MNYKKLHEWEVSIEEAIEIQKRLRSQLTFEEERRDYRTIGGIDVSFDKGSDLVYSGIIVLEMGSFEPIEKATAELRVKFPYVPGLLSFRETPAVIKAWEKLKTRPDCIVCDGQGLAHQRRFGIACHLGLIFDVPSIGCAKSLLVGRYSGLGERRGSTAPLVDRGEVVGMAVRTKDNVEPVYVSQGYRIGLERAVQLVLDSAIGYRIPEPTRQAHLLVNEARRRGGAPEQRGLF